jgi:uncharacterized protein YqgC (DUF456 family)
MALQADRLDQSVTHERRITAVTTWIHALDIALLVLALGVGWILTVVGMPGNWLIAAAVALYVYVVPADSAGAIGRNVVIALVCLALCGEVLELIAASLGAKRRGASFRGAAMALFGSVVGGTLGLFVGLPIPLFGPIVAGILLAGFGAFVGAILGETSLGRDLHESIDIGTAAFWGRLLGTLAKVMIGSTMVAIVLVALVF